MAHLPAFEKVVRAAHRLELVAAAVLAGCSPPTSAGGPPAGREGTCAVAEALRGGTLDERLLALDRDQQGAVVALYGEGDLGPEPVCSGVLVSFEHVLTAAHCVRDAPKGGRSLTVRVGRDAAEPERVAEIAQVDPHPRLDLALLVLSYAMAEADGVEPLAVRTVALDPLVIGRDMAVAGYGLDDDLLAGTRAFGVVQVAGLEAEHLRVTGVDGTGLCFGDSGGPLFARATDGQPEVLGILTKGSAACNGSGDRYTRLDRAGAWLDATLPVAAPWAGRSRCGAGEAKE